MWNFGSQVWAQDVAINNAFKDRSHDSIRHTHCLVRFPCPIQEVFPVFLEFNKFSKIAFIKNNIFIIDLVL
jgi:hypothetical protein